MCCDVRYDFRIKTIFDLSLSPVVCRRDHVLFACGGVQHVLYCVSALFSVLPNVYYIYHRNISMIKKIEGIKPCVSFHLLYMPLTNGPNYTVIKKNKIALP
jgi:hypothetical protein